MNADVQERAFATHAQYKIREYRKNDLQCVSELWSDVICEFATPKNRAQFEEYSEKAIEEELMHVAQQYAQVDRNAFWVCEVDDIIVGTVGIQCKAPQVVELRRMYLRKQYRSVGIAHSMLVHAEKAARKMSYSDIASVTAKIQVAAIRFYEKHGYTKTESETSSTMSEKSVGLNLTRFHYTKSLLHIEVTS